MGDEQKFSVVYGTTHRIHKFEDIFCCYWTLNSVLLCSKRVQLAFETLYTISLILSRVFFKFCTEDPWSLGWLGPKKFSNNQNPNDWGITTIDP